MPLEDPQQLVLYRSKVDIAYGELRRRIISGAIPPLQSLNQEQLAASLGMSTTPVREALRRLETEGLVVTNAHRDVVVAEIDVADLPHLFRCKEVLECLAAVLASEHATSDDIDQMERALAGVGGQDSDRHQASLANREIHTAIYRASHNPILIEILDRLWERFERVERILAHVVLNPVVEHEHVAIVKAISERRGAEAEVLMAAHLMHGRKAIETDLA